tara:strand:+ start:3357 stop:3821 length:465 start_codon:yes stop_codon:yes gene_type:complete
MSSSTSNVVRIPINNPIGPNIIQANSTGIETCIGLPAANIRIQMYLPMKVSITKKCNHANMIISSLENSSITNFGVGISEPNATRTSAALGNSRMAYEAINGNEHILTSPTIFLVMSCFGRNHIKIHRGNMKIEENQKVTLIKSILLPHHPLRF